MWYFGNPSHKKSTVRSGIFYLGQRKPYMKTSRLSGSHIIAILKQAKAGSPVPELCREHIINHGTFHE